MLFRSVDSETKVVDERVDTILQSPLLIEIQKLFFDLRSQKRVDVISCVKEVFESDLFLRRVIGLVLLEVGIAVFPLDGSVDIEVRVRTDVIEYDRTVGGGDRSDKQCPNLVRCGLVDRMDPVDYPRLSVFRVVQVSIERISIKEDILLEGDPLLPGVHGEICIGGYRRKIGGIFALIAERPGEVRLDQREGDRKHEG